MSALDLTQKPIASESQRNFRCGSSSVCRVELSHLLGAHQVQPLRVYQTESTPRPTIPEGLLSRAKTTRLVALPIT